MKKIDDYLEIDSETFERFAWLPKKMSNDKRVWLKKYIEIRNYVDLFGRPPIKHSYYTSYFTVEDHLMNMLKGDKFNPDPSTEFTGHQRHNIYSYHQNKE